MEILRVFNNNVVLARDLARGEVILTGRGLGFQAKPGQPVDPAKVVKVFVPDEGRDPDNFGQLVAAIPPEHLNLADQALEVARQQMRVSSSSSIVVALADHLSFAIKRVLKGIQLEYPLHAEVAHLYPDELAVAERIVVYVNEHITVPLPPEEAVPIALHLVNAGFVSGDLSFTYTMTGVIQQMLAVVRERYGVDVSHESMNVARFITHVRYLFVRVQQHQQLTGQEATIGVGIRQHYPEATRTAQQLATIVELRLGRRLSEDEVSYLALHVARMTMEADATAA